MVQVFEMKLTFSLTFFIWCSFSYGASDTDEVSVSVMEGDSVTLNTGVETKEQEKIIWYFNDIRIALISGDLSKTCTDVQCNEGTERFRDRLKLDHQTGSLTITNTRNTDAGVYQLKIIISSGISSSRKKIFTVAVHGVGPDGTSAFVMEGDSVTLHTGVETKQQEKIIWYFNDIRIAQNTGDQSKICTDVQCKQRFRGRLELDHQTGSLTITNITNTDSGEYKLKNISSSGSTEKIFNITVCDVPAAERDEVKRKSVKEGESVTFDTCVIKHSNDVMTWYFNDILIAEVTGDQSKICTNDQCKERFRDRLELDHQTGSLTIMNTTNTDSGEYTLKINSGSISIIKTFSSFIHSVTDSGPSGPSAAAGISVAVITAVVVLLVVAAVAGVIHYRRHQGKANLDNCGGNQFERVSLLAVNGNGMVHPPADTQLPADNGTGPPTANGTCPTAANGTCPTAANGSCPPAADGTCSPAADGMCPTAAEGTCPPAADGTGLHAADRTGLHAANGTGPPAADGTGPPTANGTCPTAANGTCPTAADGTGPPTADGTCPTAANGTCPTAADGTCPTAADGTGPPAADGTGLHAADGTDPPAADGMGPPAADGMGPPAANGTVPP